MKYLFILSQLWPRVGQIHSRSTMKPLNFDVYTGNQNGFPLDR